MSLLIKGMEMPKDGEWISVSIFPGWKCFAQSWCGKDFNFAEKLTAVRAPPHGRLIDADALAEHKFVSIPHVSIDGKNAETAYRLGWNTAIETIMENAKTIIGGE